jgi:hypothetical protein
MKTGYYIRIFRNGHWLNLDITECTNEELREFFKTAEKDRLIYWIISLKNTLEDI